MGARTRTFLPSRIVCLTEETVETLYRRGEQDRVDGISGYVATLEAQLVQNTQIVHSRLVTATEHAHESANRGSLISARTEGASSYTIPRRRGDAMHWAIRYQAEQEGKDGTRLSLGDFNEAGVPAQTSIFVPRHQLAVSIRPST